MILETLLVAAIVLLILALCWVGQCKDNGKKALAEKEVLIRHYQLQADELAQRFQDHGTHAIVWRRPKAHNKADDFYYRVRIAMSDYLFTEEALGVARDRGQKAKERGWL